MQGVPAVMMTGENSVLDQYGIWKRIEHSSATRMQKLVRKWMDGRKLRRVIEEKIEKRYSLRGSLVS